MAKAREPMEIQINPEWKPRADPLERLYLAALSTADLDAVRQIRSEAANILPQSLPTVLAACDARVRDLTEGEKAG